MRHDKTKKKKVEQGTLSLASNATLKEASRSATCQTAARGWTYTPTVIATSRFVV